MPLKDDIPKHPKEQNATGEDAFISPDRRDQIARDPNLQEETIEVFKPQGEPVRLKGEEGEDKPLARGEGEEEDKDTRRRPKLKKTDEEEDSDYSKKVQRRINREVALRRQAEARVQDERAARQRSEERLNKIERTQAELASNTSIKELEAKIATLTGQLKQAIEDGNTAQQLELTIQIGDVQADMKLKKYELEQRARETAREPQEASRDALTPSGDRSRGQQFVQANEHWWNDEGGAISTVAIGLDKAVLGEINSGKLTVRPYSDDHFKELAKRLHRVYPELEVCLPDGTPIEIEEPEEEADEEQDVKPRNNARPPVGALTGRGARHVATETEQARAGKITLTQDDFHSMRLFNLDPTNATHKKRYAEQKMRALLSEQGASR